MRQDKEYFYVLKEIEETEKPGRPAMYHNIRELYLSSRLCDLSRPPELREIDTNIVGVKELFLSELLQEIWEKAVPDVVPDTEIQMKAKMVPIYDDFVKSFCFSRTMTAENSLENSEVFTMAVLDAMVIAVTIMYALKMYNEMLEGYDEDGHQKFRWEFIRKGIDIVDIEGEESDIEDLDSEEERIIQEAIAAEEKATRLREEEAAAALQGNATDASAEAKKEGEMDGEEKKGEAGPEIDNAAQSLDPAVVPEEPDVIETISQEELIGETRDFFRNNYHEKMKVRRIWGQKIMFQSSPFL
jgi:hypothetical protein